MKRLAAFALALMLCAALPVASKAAEAESPVQEGLEYFGVNGLLSELPPSAVEFARRAGLEERRTLGDWLTMTPAQFVEAIREAAFLEFNSARGSLFAIVAVVLLCAAVGCLGWEGSAAPVFEAAAALTVTAVLSRPVMACVEHAAQVVGEASRFLISYIPVYTAVITAGGMPMSGAAYHVVVMAAAQVAAQLAARVIIPLCGVYLVLCIAGGISKNKAVTGLSTTLRKIINGTLIVVMTAFVGILSIQGFMNSAADTIAIRTTKFLVGSFVPVVGSIISDALGAAQGSLRVIKATVGGFGVAVAVLTFLPVVLEVTVLRAVVLLASAAGEMLSAGQVRDILTGFSNLLAVVTALLLSMAMLMIISTAIMMTLGGAA